MCFFQYYRLDIHCPYYGYISSLAIHALYCISTILSFRYLAVHL